MSASRSSSVVGAPRPPIVQTNAKAETALHLENIDNNNMTSADRPSDKLDTYVDDERAAEYQRQLATNHMIGWKPSTPEEVRLNKKLNLKLDLMVLPIVALGYMFNSLDRTNLGNAQAAGFSKDINVRASAVNDASSLFYATYVPLSPFAAALGRKIGAPRFLGACLVSWGILTISHAFVKSEAQLIAVRLLMGIAESGFYPSVLAYLSDIYPRYDCGFRMALFYGMMAVAGSFGGLIAYGILHAHGALYNWQYLFILEGCIPIILGIICPFLLARDIQSAWYLTPEQRTFAARRMKADSASNIEGQRRVTYRDFIEAVTDWRVWTTMLSNLLATMSSQGFSIFFPVVVKGLGYTSGAKANLMTVPPYLVGAIGVWIVAWSSDKLQERTYHLLGGMFVVILGFTLTIVIPLEKISARYGALIILEAGAFIHSPLTVAWLAGNTPEPGKRSVALGISGFANLAGTIGSQLFKPKYGPTYHTPLTITTGLLAVGWAGFGATGIALRLINKSRAKKLARMTPEEIEEENRSDERVGDKKWTFVYGL